jgi:HEAT repeat protein
MSEALAYGTVVLASANAVLLVLLVARRVGVARRERRDRRAEQRLRPLALALVDGEDLVLPRLSRADALVFARLLARYAHALRGSASERIATYFERNGSIEAEVRTLRDRRTWRRANAAYALGDMSSRSAVPALVSALEDRAPQVRAAAARSLGRLGALEAVSPLVRALAAQAVPPAVAGFALLQIGPDALAGTGELLAHEEQLVRARAAELVGLVGDAGDAELLLELLRDTSAEVRAAAAGALGRLGAEAAASALRAALGDRVPFVRAAAASALGATGDREAFEVLRAQAEGDIFEPACSAAAALAAVDPERLLEAAARPDAGRHLVEAADLLAVPS